MVLAQIQKDCIYTLINNYGYEYFLRNPLPEKFDIALDNMVECGGCSKLYFEEDLLYEPSNIYELKRLEYSDIVDKIHKVMCKSCVDRDMVFIHEDDYFCYDE